MPPGLRYCRRSRRCILRNRPQHQQPGGKEPKSATLLGFRFVDEESSRPPLLDEVLKSAIAIRTSEIHIELSRPHDLFPGPAYERPSDPGGQAKMAIKEALIRLVARCAVNWCESERPQSPE